MDEALAIGTGPDKGTVGIKIGANRHGPGPLVFAITGTVLSETVGRGVQPLQ